MGEGLCLGRDWMSLEICLSLVPGPAGACLGPGSLRGEVLSKHRCWGVCPWGSKDKSSVELGHWAGLSLWNRDRLRVWLAVWLAGRENSGLTLGPRSNFLLDCMALGAVEGRVPARSLS